MKHRVPMTFFVEEDEVEHLFPGQVVVLSWAGRKTIAYRQISGATSQGSEPTNQQKGTNTTMSSNNLPTSRNHRTALVIDVRNGAGDNGTFVERYRRLLESVNGDQIKVDVFTLRDGGDGVGLVAGSPDDVETETSGDEIDLKAWAKGLGYDQVVIAFSPAA